MKRQRVIFITALVYICLCFACACTAPEPNESGAGSYTIQYTDNTGIHTIEVETGGLYAIESIPQKNGYDFMGLFDAEVGGTQYVNAGGSSVSVFTDNKNIVLYPQFKAKEYTLILDYQGAAVTGTRSMKVAYDSEITELPLNVSLAHKNFVGWFTQPSCHGKQIADNYGVLPESQKVTEKVFDLSDSDGFVKIYAGFENARYTVTFYYDDNGSEEVQVEYDTPISDVIPQKRVNGMAVLSWSKKRNDENKEYVFNGKVTDDMILYAVEYAPIIDFDSAGGNAVTSLVAAAGSAISLPAPKKDNYKFLGWRDGSGNIVDYSTMPESSRKLYAAWQAMIMFDTNGGTEVENISVPHGTKIELPETEKDGYIFAGWYDESGNKYTSKDMPSESIVLIARYYKQQFDTVEVLSSSRYNYATTPSFTTGPTYHYFNRIDIGFLIEKEVKDVIVTVQYTSYKEKTTMHSSYPLYTSMDWYSSKEISSSNCIWSYTDEHYGNTADSYTRSTEITLTSSELYICYYSRDKHGKNGWWDFNVVFEYLDTSTLY